MFGDLHRSRSLAWRLATRDIKAQYRDSLFGFLWAFVTPLFSAMTWIVLNATGIIRIADTGIPYPAYIFSGTMLWQVFTEALNGPLTQLNGSRSLLSKLNFTRESILIAALLKTLFSAGIKFIILFPVLFLFDVYPDLHILLFPFAVLVLILVGFTIGLLLAPVGMLYGDISRALPIVTQLAMYTSPVIFALPKHGLMHKVFMLNFMTPVVLTARAWATGSASPMPFYFLGVALVFLILLFFSWIVFRVTMPVIIERMSS
jgi:lipopolysaccharide transport system permease protein